MTSRDIKATVNSFFNSYFDDATRAGVDNLLETQKKFDEIKDIFNLDMIFMQKNHYVILFIDLEMDRYVTIKSVYDNIKKAFGNVGIYDEDNQKIANSVVHPDFREAYLEFLNRARLIQSIEEKFGTKTFSYKRLNDKKEYIWSEMEIVPQAGFGNGHHRVLAYMSNISEEQAKQAENQTLVDSLSNIYFAVYNINIEDDTFDIIKAPENGYFRRIMRDLQGQGYSVKDGFEKVIEQQINPEYRSLMYHFVNIENLGQRIGSKSSLSVEYVRTDIGWCRGIFIPIKWSAEGELLRAIYAETNINEEKLNREKLQNVQRQLVQERNIGRQMSYKAEHDPLTGVLNRAGLDRLLVAAENMGGAMGVAIIDVDLFKGINDTYGHNVGDQVLIQVANLLKNSFRGSDFVARLGGDEFCVLMNHVNTTHQDTVIEKFRDINDILMQPSKEIPPVSLSVGVAFAENGNYAGLFNMADKALYQVKKSVRGRCIVYDPEQKDAVQEVIPVTSDSSLLQDRHFVIARSFAGMWRIELPDAGEPRLFADEGMQKMMSFSENMSPEACYKYWRAGIEPEYVPILEKALQELPKTGPGETYYLWNHPLYGKLKVRVSGSHNPNFEGGQCFCGMLQNVTNIRSINKSDNESIMIQAISNIFNFIYYVDLRAKTFVSFKNLKDADGVTGKDGDLDAAVAEFLELFVDARSTEAMRSFLNTETLNYRLRDRNTVYCEYINTVMNCWCLATMIVAERDSEGLVTKVMIGSSRIDGEKRKELEQQEILKSLYERYQLICRVHLDDEHYHAIANDRRLEQIISKGMASSASFARMVDKFVDPTYKNAVLRFLDTKTMNDRLRRVDSLSMEFKEREFGWCIMEIVASAYDPMGCITDVLVIVRTIQNENMDNNQRLLMHGYDSLTGLRNKENFLASANRHRGDTRPLAYMLIDIDNFQELKEKHGPDVANAVLVKCATVIRSEAPHNSVGCHMEADQFAVFVKNMSSDRVRELVKYADAINARFKNNQDGLPAFTASVGIVFSEAGYKDELYRQAFESMLPLKEFGGNGYRIYDETVMSNKHLTYDDWRRIMNYCPTVLRVIETKLSDYAFFADVDLEKDTYQYLITHELPTMQISMRGAYSDMVEYAKRISQYNCAPDNSIMTADRLQDAFVEGREYLSKEFQDSRTKKWYALKFFCLERKDDKVKRLIIGWRDITKEKQRLSGDPITGAQLFNVFLHRAPHFLPEDHKTEFDILYFNFKEFKNINTALGFANGDNVLRRFTERLRESSLHPLLIARESGDRFYCLVEHKNLNLFDLTDLCQMKEISGEQVLVVRLHCGIYHIEQEESDIRSMCDKARAASAGILNEFAKPYAFYNPEEDSRQMQKFELLHNVEEALKKGEFKVFYQPIFDAKTHEIASAEALIRWQQPDGLVPPGRFLPMLEETGYISLVDLFVFSDAKRLLEERTHMSKLNVPIAINLSRMDMLNDDMLYRLRNQVLNMHIDKSLIRFEITESSYIDISENGKEFLSALHDVGMGLAVDDFGVGYSSLATLVGQRFDIIKLDMSYIQQIGVNEKAGLIIQSIIKMAHDMGSKTIAEGVETKSQLDFLRESGCDYIQGYYFSRPLPEEEFVKLLD